MGRVSEKDRMSIFDVLIREHRTVESLFDQILALCEEAEGERTQDLEALFEVLSEKLVAHSEIEDDLVYERLAEIEELEPAILKSREAHGVVETLLDELRGLGVEDPVFAAKLQLLRDVFLQHKDEEEGPIFELAGDELDADESEELAGRYVREAVARTGDDPTDEHVVGEGGGTPPGPRGRRGAQPHATR